MIQTIFDVIGSLINLVSSALQTLLEIIEKIPDYFDYVKSMLAWIPTDLYPYVIVILIIIVIRAFI